jgi:acyl-CoA thioester hydrolase
MSEQRIITYRPEIRFADIDIMGHVNNAVYLSYFEQARMNYFHELLEGSWDWKKDGILLAHNSVDYLKPITLHDKIDIKVWCDKVGNKSISMKYSFVNSVSREETTKGQSVLVSYNYLEQKSIRVPEKWREIF